MSHALACDLDEDCICPPVGRRGLTIGSLFSGIGGLELGLERAGLGPVLWQCEIDPFCRRVLAKHWPTVTRFEDVTQPRSYPHVDVICGGFPCQDVSSAGKQRGLGGARSGLWYHFASIVAKVRPSFVVIENVASGAPKWLPSVRRHLHMLGYDSAAYAISAADVGAPHIRRRVFVVAHASGGRRRKQQSAAARIEVRLGTPDRSELLAYANGAELRQQQRRGCGASGEGAPFAERHGEPGSLAHPDGERWHRRGRPVELNSDDADDSGTGAGRGATGGNARWAPEPNVGRVANGVPSRVDRLRALGNAVVPQCAEVVGRVIMASQHKGKADP